jgi:hypothetical protein
LAASCSTYSFFPAGRHTSLPISNDMIVRVAPADIAMHMAATRRAIVTIRLFASGELECRNQQSWITRPGELQVLEHALAARCRWRTWAEPFAVELRKRLCKKPIPCRCVYFRESSMPASPATRVLQPECNHLATILERSTARETKRHKSTPRVTREKGFLDLSSVSRKD